MKTFFMNRGDAKTYRPQPNSAIISIWTPGDKPLKALKYAGWRYIHSVDFHDSDSLTGHTGHNWPYDDTTLYPPITDTQAADMVRFIKQVVDKDVDLIAVHCDAGISRSAGVAMFIKDVYDAELVIVRHDTSGYNRFVHQQLVKAAGLGYEL